MTKTQKSGMPVTSVFTVFACGSHAESIASVCAFVAFAYHVFERLANVVIHRVLHANIGIYSMPWRGRYGRGLGGEGEG